MNIYDFSLTKSDGEDFSLSDFKGKVIMIVNIATRCGFTKQLGKLEALYQKYKDRGFEIIAVPCNQFKNQTPEEDEDVEKFCRLFYNAEFTLTKKSDVNGKNQLPLYDFLKKNTGFSGFGHGLKSMAMSMVVKSMDKNYKHNPDIKWNFTKFLIDKNGNVVRRFEPVESDFNMISREIESLL